MPLTNLFRKEMPLLLQLNGVSSVQHDPDLLGLRNRNETGLLSNQGRLPRQHLLKYLRNIFGL